MKQKEEYKRIVFIEYPLAYERPDFCDKLMEEFESVFVKRMIKSELFPRRLGNYTDQEEITKLFRYPQVGGWVQALYPHIKDLLPYKYICMSGIDLIGDIQLISEAIAEDRVIILLSFSSKHRSAAIYLSNHIKKRHMNSLLIIGGPHVNAEPHLSVMETEADVAVYGEADHLIRPLIESILVDKTFSHKSILYKGSNSKPSFTFASIDDRLHTWSVFLSENVESSSNICRLTLERFCKAQCGFCSKLHCRSHLPEIATYGIEWLRAYQDIIGKNDIYLKVEDSDFNLTAYNKTDFYNFLKDSNISWSTSIRVGLADNDAREAIKSASNSGCHKAFIGVESFQDKLLKAVNKQIKSEDMIPYFELLKSSGIRLFTNLIIGLPFQTKDDIAKDIEIAKGLIRDGLLDVVHASVLGLYPGTPFKNNPTKYGIIIEDDNTDNLDKTIQHSTRELTSSEIKESYKYVLQELGNSMAM